MDRDRGDPIYIDTKAMIKNKVGLKAVGLAMDLMCLVWWPTKSPFTWDPKKLTELLVRKLPARGYTERKLRRYAKGVKTFFTVLPDGRWAPNPKFFSMTDGNPGSQS